MENYITIVTPTYNRGYKLPILFESLKRQTNKNFEWIVIDDGSTDDTKQIISGWNIKEFPFLYIQQKNGGKHRAVNKALLYVKTKFVFIVDSDDYLLDDAIENIEKWVKEIESDSEIAAVSGLKVYPNGKRVSGFPKGAAADSYIIASNFERWKKGLTGDQAEIYRAELLKRFPFPEFEGENFISESAILDKIASEGYRVKWINTPIYVCEYLEDGLTKNLEEIELRNFIGFTYARKLAITHLTGWYRLKNIIKYIKISKKKGLSLNEISKILEIKYFYILIGYGLLLIYSIYKK